MASCAGCGRNHVELGYTADDSVYEDGSYYSPTDEFVCDECYIVLIKHGRDVGDPKFLTDWARALCTR